MYRTMLSRIALTAFATAALGAAAAAHARTDVHVSFVTTAPVVVTRPVPVHAPAPQVVYGQPAPVYGAPPVYDAPPAYGDDRRHDRERAWRRACRAARWEPNERYMPGERVWRHGTMYVATRLSASVWNVNSPPESTPNYWRATDCSPRARYGHAREW